MIDSHIIQESLLWRYATKKFDAQKKLSDTQVSILLESLTLSPSSFGLQWWGFVVVENPEYRKQIMSHARNQAQVVDASHLLVLCRRTDVDLDFVQRYIQTIADTRSVSLESLDGYKQMIMWFVSSKDTTALNERLTKQTYIAQWMLLSTCAMLHIDACPMEWFDPKACDEILWLADRNLASCVLVPVGYRAAEDVYASAPKVRFTHDELVVVI